VDPTEPTRGTGAAGPDPDPSREPASGPGAGPRSTGPTHHTTTSWWDSTAGPAGPTEAAGPAGANTRPDPVTERFFRARARARPAQPTADSPPPDLGRAAAEIADALIDERFGGVRGRLVRAVLGWLPIALGLGWLVGELTGCGRFAATCTGAAEPVLLGLQVAVFGILLVVPPAASVATTAAVTLLVAAIVASLILSATGGAADSDSRRAALGAVLLIAWLSGLAVAVARRARTLGSRARPVS
jgi:hypothetical protein